MKSFFLSLIVGSTVLFAAVDINSASKEELMSVKGIGDKKADAIIEHRNKKCFNNVEELNDIKGFGDKTVEKMKSDLEAKPCVVEKKEEKKVEEKPSEVKKDKAK